MPGHRRSLEERFWSKVQKTDACWQWIGCHARGGYGSIKHKGRVLQAHRVAYELQCGPIPDGMDVCHHCDNASCVRGDHLFAGTHTENMHDMLAKGRGQASRNRGAMNPQAKLTDDVVLHIRQWYASGRISQRRLALEYGIRQQTVSEVVSGHLWKHVS